MNLFYTKTIQNNCAYLPEEEARHAVQVLRKKVGEQIHFVDGKGGWYRGIITETGKKKCIIQIEENQQAYNKRSFHLHLAIAPTKNINRLEWFLEKATEIGIDTITPILCQRSERSRIRLDRLEKILVTAMKQSLKAYLPKLNELTAFEALIQQNTLPAHRYIAYCTEKEIPYLQNNYRVGKDVIILIGPEGDFSPEEVQLAFKHDFSGVSLGKSRLRTETAGIVACHTISLINERL